MGEVYRAHDSRLHREVAIKVLAADAAGDPERASRFAREARAVSGVSHPNIVTVYDVGRDGSIHYIAMELVDGRSLRDEMARPVPLRRVTALAAGIAQGLARAHQAGIVHRDLKPDNVMLSADGVPKIVDFGLAKATGPSAGELSTATGTLPGTLLGTMAYMSPEQASGAPADFRSDQFAFGTMLYELATGQHPFRRDSPAQTLAAIIEDDPASLATAAPKVPIALRWIVERCLAKSPSDRYGSTDDLARDLARVRDHLSDLSGTDAAHRSPRRQSWAFALIPAILVAAVAWWLAAGRVPGEVGAPPDWMPVTFNDGYVHTARFAGDSQSILYAAAWDGRPLEVYSTTRSGPESRRLDVGPAGLFAMSSTGELALSTACIYAPASGLCAGTLSRAPLLGGAPRPIAEGVLSADWGPGGELAVVRRSPDGDHVEFPIGTRISADGAAHVRVSRDGRRLAWSARGGVFIRTGGEPVLVSSGWMFISGLAWSAADNAVFVSGVRTGCNECVVRLADGEAERIVLRGPGRVRLLDVAATGEMLVDRSISVNRMFTWRRESAPPLGLNWFDGSTPDALSRDGRTVLFTERSSTAIGRTALYPIYIRSTDGGPATRIGTGYGTDLSPDGRWALTLTRPSEGAPELVLLSLGPGDGRTLDRAGLALGGPLRAWFLDNERVLFAAAAADGAMRTYTQAINGGAPILVGHEPGGVVSPVAADANRFVSRRDDESYWVASLNGAPSVPLGFRVGGRERVIGWTADGRGVLVSSANDDELLIQRAEIGSGIRTVVWKAPSPLNRVTSGLLNPSATFISRDGSIVVSGGNERASTTYVVTGVR